VGQTVMQKLNVSIECEAKWQLYVCNQQVLAGITFHPHTPSLKTKNIITFLFLHLLKYVSYIFKG
jgi:hypothetical protein